MSWVWWACASLVPPYVFYDLQLHCFPRHKVDIQPVKSPVAIQVTSFRTSVPKLSSHRECVQIAAALDVPLGTVKSRLHHALLAIRQSSEILERLADE